MDACQTPAQQQSKHHRGQKREGEDERNGENEEKERRAEGTNQISVYMAIHKRVVNHILSDSCVLRGCPYLHKLFYGLQVFR